MVDQNDLLSFHQILTNILEPNNEIRKEAEAKLNALTSNKPLLIIYLSKVLLSTSLKGVKNLCCLLLNKYLSAKHSSQSESNWALLTNQKDEFKSDILKAYINENDAFIKKKIVDLIVHIAECTYEADETWADLSKLVIEGIKIEVKPENLVLLEAQVYLISQVYVILNEELTDYLGTFLSVFQTYYKTEYISLRTRTSEALVSMMFVLDKKEKKKLKPFIFDIYKVTYDSFQNPKEEENLRRNIMNISEIVNSMPGLLKANFSDLFILMGKISESKSIMDGTTREMGFDIIVSLVEKKKSLLLKDRDRTKVFLQSLFRYAFEMDDEVDEKWITPVSSSYIDEAFVPEEQVEAAFAQIDRLIDYLGFEFVMKELNEIIMELITNDEKAWKYKYVGFMMIAQIIEYVNDIKSIEVIIDTIIGNLDNPHPKIRYACMQCIEQMSEHLEPKFQNLCHGLVIPKLIQRFNDGALRNQLQACETMQAFVEHCHAEKIFKEFNYIEQILNAILSIFSNETTPISLREAILNVCSELTSVADENIIPYAEKTFLIMIDFFSKVYSNPSFKSIYGSLIELITVIGPKCELSYTKYIPDIVTALVVIQDRIPQTTDPLFENLKSAWSEVIPIVKVHYPHLIEQIFNSIMILIGNTPKVYIQTNSNNNLEEELTQIDVLKLLQEDKDSLHISKEKINNISTSETSDYAGAIEVLNTMIEKFGALFAPYYKIAEQAIIPLLNFESNAEIRIEASNTLYEIINMIASTLESNGSESNSQDKEVLCTLSKGYIVLLFNTIEKEGHNDAISAMLDNMGNIIEKVKDAFLSELELNELSEKLLKIFEKVERFRLSIIEKKKLVEEEAKNVDDAKHSDDEEEIEEDDFADELQKDIEDIEEVLVSIADVFGSIFKTHKERTLSIVHKLKEQLLVKYFMPTSSNFEKKMGIFILDDMIEHLGQKLIPDLWDSIIKIITSYISDKDHSLRQASAYGLGEIALNTLVDNSLSPNFKNELDQYLFSAISKALESNPKVESELEEWGSAKDNIVVAISKVIKNQSQNITVAPWIKLYLENMPIQYDEEEAQEQHEEFFQMLKSNPQIMLGPDSANLPRVLLICSEIYQSKLSKEEQDNEIKNLFSSVKDNPSYQLLIQEAKSICREKKVLKKLVSLLE